MKELDRKIRNAGSLPELFELVKKTVWNFLGKEQAGLLLGLADLGGSPDAVLGAFYSPDANTIVMNTAPIAKLQRKNPGIINYYSFYILLHEYVHAIGVYDEAMTRELTASLAQDLLGDSHTVTALATGKISITQVHDMEDMFREPKGVEIEYVLGIDRENTKYIN